MKKFMKSYIVSLVLFIVLVLTGCNSYKGYQGQYPELYTVAINSLLWNNGFYASEKLRDSEIEIIEEDSYGRVLYTYWEKYSGAGTIYPFSLVICQKTEENYTFFYPDYNFITIMEKDPTGINNFSRESIQKLKDLNDWNLEINLEKSVKVDVSRTKPQPQIRKKDFEMIFKKAADGSNAFRVAHYLTSDDYGRFICYGWGVDANHNWIYLVMIFNPDGSYDLETCFIETKNFYNYYEELKDFKEINNWNDPI